MTKPEEIDIQIWLDEDALEKVKDDREDVENLTYPYEPRGTEIQSFLILILTYLTHFHLCF